MKSSLRTPGFLLVAAALCVFLAPGCISSRVGPDKEESAALRSDLPEPKQPVLAPLLFLGPEDVIQVRVWPQADMDRIITADRQGFISLPLAGRVNVAGQNLEWLRYVLTERFGEYYNDPQVLVDLIDSPLQKAFILGEVNRPGSFKITGATTVVDLIGQAHGFTDDAAMDAVVLIRGDIKTPRVIPLNIEAAMEGDLSQDHYLMRGDIVYVNRSFIGDLQMFARRIGRIIMPVYQTERALVLGAMVPDAVLHGESRTRISIAGDTDKLQMEGAE